MFRLTFKNLRANKVRFALTTFGVMLAVSFVVSAFVLGDGLRSTFTNVSEDITAGVDLEVRNVADFGDAPPLPADTVSTVAAVDGVADAVASIEAADNAVRPIKANGDEHPHRRPATAGVQLDRQPTAEPVHARRRRPAADRRVHDGRRCRRRARLRHRRHLRGHGAGRPGRSHPVGNVLVRRRQLDARRRADADEHRPGERAVRHRRHQQRRRAGRRRRRRRRRSGRGRRRRCRRPRSSTTRRCSRRRPPSSPTRSTSSATSCWDSAASRCSCRSSSSTTRSPSCLGQRTRELALLRTVGADPKQIRRSVLGEALAMGVLASAGGIGGGIAVAKGIDALFGVMGVDLSDYPLILAPRTLIAAAVIGVGVTLLAAIGPARRAATVPPIAALTGGAEAGAVGSRTPHDRRLRAVRGRTGRRRRRAGRDRLDRGRRSPGWRSARSRSSSVSPCSARWRFVASPACSAGRCARSPASPAASRRRTPLATRAAPPRPPRR